MACDRYLSSLYDRYKIVQCDIFFQCRYMLGGVLEVEEVDSNYLGLKDFAS